MVVCKHIFVAFTCLFVFTTHDVVLAKHAGKVLHSYGHHKDNKHSTPWRHYAPYVKPERGQEEVRVHYAQDTGVLHWGMHRTVVGNAPDAPVAEKLVAGNSETDENYIKDGRFYFARLRAQGNYTLREYLDSLEPWGLDPFVEMGKGVIRGLARTDWDIFKKLLIERQMPDFIQMTKSFAGIVFVMSLGLICGFAFWIIGCTFMYFRCHGKWGGKLFVKDAQRQTKMQAFVTLLLLCLSVIFLIVGAGAMFTVGKRIPETPPYVINIAEKTIDDLIDYKDQLVEELEQLSADDLVFAIESLIEEVESMPQTVTAGFIIALTPQVDKMIGALRGFGDEVNTFDTGLKNVGEAKVKAEGLVNTLQENLGWMGQNLTSLKQVECANDAQMPPAECDKLLDNTAMPALFNFNFDSDFVDEQSELLAKAKVVDAETIEQGVEDAFVAIPELVGNSTTQTRAMVVGIMENVTQLVQPIIDQAKFQLNNVTLVLEGLRIKVKVLADKMNNKAVKLLPALFSGLASAVFIQLILAMTGISLGLASCRSPPQKRGQLGAWSHRALMFSVFIAFVLMPLYMVPGSLLFAVSTPFNMVCEPVRDLTIFKEFIDKPETWDGEYPLSKVLFKNGTIELEVGEVLRKCRANMAIFTTLRLDNFMDLDHVIDLEDRIPDLSAMEESMAIVLAGVKMLDAQTLADFDSVSTELPAALDTEELIGKILTDFEKLKEELGTLHEAMQAVHDDLSSKGYVSYANEYELWMTVLDYLRDPVQVELEEELNIMSDSIEAISKSMSPIKQHAIAMLNNVQAFQSYVQTNGQQLIMQGVMGFMEGILDFAQQFVGHAAKRMREDVGRCQLIWDIFDGFTGCICKYFLDSFNGFWLALCIIGTFFIMFTITAAMMIQYFRADVTWDRKSMRALRERRRRLHQLEHDMHEYKTDSVSVSEHDMAAILELDSEGSTDSHLHYWKWGHIEGSGVIGDLDAEREYAPIVGEGRSHHMPKEEEGTGKSKDTGV